MSHDDDTAMASGNRLAHGAVLRRLLRARETATPAAERLPQLPRSAPPTPSRSAAIAVGRAADRLYRLGVQPIAVTPGALALAELPELLPDPALLAVLQGPGDLIGMMALCPETVTALIEVQTLGRITARPAERRRPTRSDAMICADFINALMADLASEMEGVDGFAGIAGYRYASYLDDPRPLALMLEDRSYRSLRFELRLGAAETRVGSIFLALPLAFGIDQNPGVSKALPQRVAASDAAPTERNAAETCDAASLSDVVRGAPIELTGVLCRRRMRLCELRGLTAGKLLSLPRVSLSEARIETARGQLVAIGKFGEADGCHAIRLRDPLLAETRSTVHDAPVPDAATADNVTGRPGFAIPEPPIDDLRADDEFRLASTSKTSQDVVRSVQTIPKPASNR